MTVGQRIKERRNEIGMSATDLAERLNISRATLYRYEKGDIEKVSTETLKEIADVLRTTPSYLMGWDGDNKGIIGDVNGGQNFTGDISGTVTITGTDNAKVEVGQELALESSDALLELQTDGADVRIEILSTLQRMEKTQKEILKEIKQIKKQPSGISGAVTALYNVDDDKNYTTVIVDGLVAAGNGVMQDEALNMEVRVPVDSVPEKYDTVARVVGDSMEPLIRDNDLLFIESSEQIEMNTIGIFTVDGNNYVKKLKRDYNGSWYLQSLNNNYEEIYLTEENDIRTIGEVVSIYR